MKEKKPRIKTKAFFRNYGRLLIGGIIIAAVLLCSICAPLLTQWDPEAANPSISKQTPSSEHILGTDYLGRDLWARILYGSRTTLLVSIGSQVLMIIVGTILGLLCGYYNKVEKFLMRILDAASTIPNLLLCMMMISVFGSGVPQMMIALAIQRVPSHARMIRNQVLSLREKEYIESAKAMGASDLRTIFVHILPACSSYLLVRFSNGLSGMIMSMTALAYLGVGLDPVVANWGGIVQEGQEFLFTVPHLVMYPAAAICLTVFGFAMLGDGLRDLLDPRLK